MSFEDRFARFGRWIDDLVYSIASKRRPSIRVGPSMSERLADGVHSAQDWVASQKNRVSAERIEAMDPRTKTIVMLVCAMLVGGATVAMTLHLMSPSGGSLTSAEVQALQKMKGSGAVSMFATPPPPTDVDGKPAQPLPPRTRGGGLTGGR